MSQWTKIRLVFFAIFFLSCGGIKHSAEIGYSGYDLGFDNSRTQGVFGTTLGYRYGPSIGYSASKELSYGIILRGNVSYLWFNSDSRRREVGNTPLLIRSNFHLLNAAASIGYQWKPTRIISFSTLAAVEYHNMFAGRFQPYYDDDEGTRKAYPSDSFNESKGRLVGDGWALGLELGIDYRKDDANIFGIFGQYTLLDNTILREYTGFDSNPYGELKYKPRNAFSIGLRYTF